jgi:hypothetical protein
LIAICVTRLCRSLYNSADHACMPTLHEGVEIVECRVLQRGAAQVHSSRGGHGDGELRRTHVPLAPGPRLLLAFAVALAVVVSCVLFLGREARAQDVPDPSGGGSTDSGSTLASAPVSTGDTALVGSTYVSDITPELAHLDTMTKPTAAEPASTHPVSTTDPGPTGPVSAQAPVSTKRVPTHAVGGSDPVPGDPAPIDRAFTDSTPAEQVPTDSLGGTDPVATSPAPVPTEEQAPPDPVGTTDPAPTEPVPSDPVGGTDLGATEPVPTDPVAEPAAAPVDEPPPTETVATEPAPEPVPTEPDPADPSATAPVPAEPVAAESIDTTDPAPTDPAAGSAPPVPSEAAPIVDPVGSTVPGLAGEPVTPTRPRIGGESGVLGDDPRCRRGTRGERDGGRGRCARSRC